MTEIRSMSIDDVELDPKWEIDGVTVLEGDPKARGYLLYESGPDGAGFRPGGQAVGIFACDPHTVSFELVQNETVHVLEGEVRIELEDGTVAELAMGDVALLPRGQQSTWTFKTPYKELWVLGP